MSCADKETELANAQILHGEYVLAEKKVLVAGQEYTINNRVLTRADLRWIQKERKNLCTRIKQLESGQGSGVRVQRVSDRYDW